MILSASRRTDIPNYYSDWFFKRIQEKYVLIRNPMNIHQVSRVDLSPDIVDCIVFWTKNPKPMLSSLKNLKDYKYYFQFTLNSYGKDVEKNIPIKNDVLIPIFQNLSDKIGPGRVIWRYDPILLNKKYSINYHLEYFDKIAYRLKDSTEKCIISFIDFYRNTERNMKDLELYEMTDERMLEIAKGLSAIANDYKLNVETCCENIALEKYGIEHARCIDDRLIERITGYKLDVEKDKNQRLECGCVSSIDIGMYNTCLNECKYCYANFSEEKVKENFNQHDINSKLLYGELSNNDTINEREVKSLRRLQLDMFDQIKK